MPGAVTVDGAAAQAPPLAGGELIRGRDARARRRPTPAEPVPFAIAYEDDHLLVVDKPAGVVVHPARGHRTGTLAQALAAHGAAGGEPWRAGIVHRLDRETSGLLVVAKHDDVHRALKALLAARELRREYLALVEGHPQARTGTIDAPIGRDRRDRVLMSIDTDDPREARTHFAIERVLPGRDAAARRRWRPDAPTRSACTWRRSAIRCAATRSTARPGRYGLDAPVPARRAAGLPASGDRRGGRRAARRCPRISRRARSAARRAKLKGGGAARPKAAPPHCCEPIHRR